MIARSVVAGRTPGLAQLGQFWLPLTHLMMLPLVWNDWLFHTGLAGSIPSSVAYVVGAVYLFKLSRLLFASSAAGWVSAAAFLLNPNVLYMQATAMTEIPLLSAAIVAIFYTARWARTERVEDLVKAAVATVAGTLIRYDGWPLAVALAVIVTIIVWRRQGWVAAQAHAFLFGVMAFSGCVAWVIYDQLLFGNGLGWYNGPYSAAFQEVRINSRGGLPTHGNWLLSLHVYSQNVVDTVGLPVLILAGAGMLLWCLKTRLQLTSWPIYATLVPLAFNVLSLERGITVMRTPELPVNGAATWFNVRYGLEMVPAIALFLGLVVAHRRWMVRAPWVMRAMTLAVLVAGLGWYAVGNTFGALPYVLHDPLQNRSASTALTAQQVGRYLATHYTRGSVLLSYSPFAPAVFYSQLPDHVFLTDGNGAQYRAAITAPQEHDVTWILMDPGSINFDPISTVLDPRTDWRQNYVLRATIGTAQLYERLPDAASTP